MKKLISLLALVAIATATFAQSAADLAKQQREQNKAYMKLVNMKPSKTAKKQAKEYKKQGWEVPAGENSLEVQFTKSQLYGEELMTDEEGNTTNRYYQHTGSSVAGAYNTAFAAARAYTLGEVASMIRTQLVAAWQANNDNAQADASAITTDEQFNQRMKAIVDESITNYIPTVKMFRRVGNNIEVMVRLAFDKKELSARLKRNIKKELKEEGDEKLNGVVDELINQKLQ